MYMYTYIYTHTHTHRVSLPCGSVSQVWYGEYFDKSRLGRLEAKLPALRIVVPPSIFAARPSFAGSVTPTSSFLTAGNTLPIRPPPPPTTLP